MTNCFGHERGVDRFHCLGRRSFNEALPGHEIRSRGEQDAFGLQPVPPRSADFLLVMVDRLGHGRMQHEPQIGFVDAHAKGHRGHDHVAFFGGECFLGDSASVGIHAGVIR